MTTARYFSDLCTTCCGVAAVRPGLAKTAVAAAPARSTRRTTPGGRIWDLLTDHRSRRIFTAADEHRQHEPDQWIDSSTARAPWKNSADCGTRAITV
jgi:hypothetical protein